MFQKFFGTIRQAAGGNEHPTCPTFLHLYKLLSIYNIIKPPKYGNCTSDGKKFEQVITVADLKEAYKHNPHKTKTSAILDNLKSKLDHLISYSDWEAEDVIQYATEDSVIDCIIYYVTGSKLISIVV